MRIAVYVFLLIFLIGFYFTVPGGLNNTIISGLLITALFSLLLFASKKERNPMLKGQYLRHSTLALIGITIVFFQFPLDYLLGNVSGSNMYIWVSHNTINKSITLSVIGLISFLIGYLCFRRRERITKNVTHEGGAFVKTNGLVLLAFISLVAFFLTINPLYLLGNYYGMVEMGGQASYAILFFRISIFAAVIQKIRNMALVGDIPTSFRKYLKKLGWPLILLSGIYFVAFIMSGDRGELIVLGLLFFSGYYMITKKRLALKYLIFSLIVGAFAITLLGIARTYRDLGFNEKITKGLTSGDTRRETSVSPSTAELSWSIKTLNTAVNYVPSNRDFFYGRFQLQQILRIAPFFNVFYPLIFSEAKYVRYEGSSGNRFASSGNYITWIRQGDYVSYGEGTSCMADLYLDFGLVGIILGMFVFGYLMHSAEVSMFSRNMPGLFSHIFSVVYFCSVIFIARGTLLADLRTVVWVYILLVVNRDFLQRIFIAR